MESMAIPEPGLLVLLAVGAVGCMTRRRLRRYAAAAVLAALLAGPGTAPADQAVSIDDPVEVETGLYSYTVRLLADSGDEASGAWDGSFEGSLNQVFRYWGMVPTPTMTSASLLSPEELARDSHFLMYDADLTWADAPYETAECDYLGMAAGFSPSIRSQNFQLAQIVVAYNETVTMSGLSADVTGTAWVTEASITGGQEAMCASWEQQTEDRTVKTGQAVTIRTTPAAEVHEWCVWREFEVVPGLWAGGIVASFTVPDFEFVPTEPGKYWVQPAQDLLSLPAGGESPTPSTVIFEVTPEPATVGLLTAGALGLLRRRRVR